MTYRQFCIVYSYERKSAERLKEITAGIRTEDKVRLLDAQIEVWRNQLNSLEKEAAV